MARKSKVEAEKTRKRILACALTLFARKGYEHTTFTDIAARLKMTKGAVYWYFETKEALLVELVRLALEKFHRQLQEKLPDSKDLTFMVIAEMMASLAEVVSKDATGRDFFVLMHGQIRWSDQSMSKVRGELFKDSVVGPFVMFQRALENDVAMGRIRKDISVVAVASAAIALWDGLVKARIDGFLECELGDTLRDFYRGTWESFKIKE